MAVVVEQTLPFPPASLDLTSSTRWNTLFPLLRPTIAPIQTSKGQTLLVDTSKARQNPLHIIAIGSAGNFSSKLLDEKHITAIVTESSGGAGILTAQDIPHALQAAGIELGNGVVVVRCGKERKLDVHEPGVIEVISAGELEADHIMSLLGSATGGTKGNPHQMAELLKAFVRSACATHSTFHTEKAEGNPAIVHAEGAGAFKGCREAVERDLKSVMKTQAGQEEGGEVVYSVHFSDVNGLSRLENYIVAGEIAKFLGMYTLLPCTRWTEILILHCRRPKCSLHPFPQHHPQPHLPRSRLLYLHRRNPQTLPLPLTQTHPS